MSELHTDALLVLLYNIYTLKIFVMTLLGSEDLTHHNGWPALYDSVHLWCLLPAMLLRSMQNNTRLTGMAYRFAMAGSKCFSLWKFDQTYSTRSCMSSRLGRV